MTLQAINSNAHSDTIIFSNMLPQKVFSQLLVEYCPLEIFGKRGHVHEITHENLTFSLSFDVVSNVIRSEGTFAAWCCAAKGNCNFAGA